MLTCLKSAENTQNLKISMSANKSCHSRSVFIALYVWFLFKNHNRCTTSIRSLKMMTIKTIANHNFSRNMFPSTRQNEKFFSHIFEEIINKVIWLLLGSTLHLFKHFSFIFSLIQIWWVGGVFFMDRRMDLNSISKFFASIWHIKLIAYAYAQFTSALIFIWVSKFTFRDSSSCHPIKKTKHIVEQ